MAAKCAMETLNKLVFKRNRSKSVDMKMQKVERENQQLEDMKMEKVERENQQLEDMKRSGGDSDLNKLLERILYLESEREKVCKQLQVKDQVVCFFRQQLCSTHGEVVSSLLNQLQEKQQEAQQFQALLKETEDKYCVVSERCDTLEKQNKVSSGELATVQEQLRDALEKDQKCLVCDQKREAYVQGVLAKTKELEMQLKEANKALQQLHKEATSNGQSAQRELKAERARVSRLQTEVKDLSGRYEERSREAAQARKQLLEERKRGREALQEERRCSSERVARLRKRLVKLLIQMPLSAGESENEQLHKVFEQLRKLADQMTHLEPSTQQRESRNVLDESMLECPICDAPYPASQYRELLAHLDYCFR